jgi:hypothetical protein
MLHSVARIKTGVSEERIPSIIRVTRIGELRTTLAVNINRSALGRNTGGYEEEMFPRNVGSYKSQAA